MIKIPETISSVLNEVAMERLDQQAKHGWTLEKDDAYTLGELALGGAAYAMSASPRGGSYAPLVWPFQIVWWKPKTPREDLVRAAALIVAEIERIDRTNEGIK